MLSLSLLALTPLFVSQAAAHGYIKSWSVNGGQSMTAQKTNIQQSGFRAVPQNTGWIGSNFLSSSCLVCGCENTPLGQVAAPSGTNFADASQSAGQTPSLPAGQSVQLLVAGNPGQGWPHPTGHLQVYLGKCTDPTSCSNFDASTAQYFKILSIPNGVPALRAAYDKSRDGNPWNIQIPSAVPAGAYILRAEIIAYGQSSQVEGNQQQLYPFCGQIAVTGGSSANSTSNATVSFLAKTSTTSNSTSSTSSSSNTTSASGIETIKFPDAYAQVASSIAGGIAYVPGPQVAAIFGGSSTFSGGSSLDPTGSTLGDSGSSTAGGSGGMSSSSDSGTTSLSGGSVTSAGDMGSSGGDAPSSGSGDVSNSGSSQGSTTPSTSTNGNEGKGKKGCTKGKKKPPTPNNKLLVPIVPQPAGASPHKRGLERRARRHQSIKDRIKREETIFM